eukprot:gene31772-38403_t
MPTDPAYADNEIISSMLYSRLLVSQSYVGKLEAQNDLLKLRLSMVVERLGELGESAEDVKLQLPLLQQRQKQLPPSNQDTNQVVPAIDPVRLTEEIAALYTPKIDELETALLNLKAGFKRREASLQDQLQQHKEALYSLYDSHKRVKKQLSDLTTRLCDNLTSSEKILEYRVEGGERLLEREGEILGYIQGVEREEQDYLQRGESVDDAKPGKVSRDGSLRRVGTDVNWKREMVQYNVREADNDAEPEQPEEAEQPQPRKEDDDALDRAIHRDMSRSEDMEGEVEEWREDGGAQHARSALLAASPLAVDMDAGMDIQEVHAVDMGEILASPTPSLSAIPVDSFSEDKHIASYYKPVITSPALCDTPTTIHTMASPTSPMAMQTATLTMIPADSPMVQAAPATVTTKVNVDAATQTLSSDVAQDDQPVDIEEGTTEAQVEAHVDDGRSESSVISREGQQEDVEELDDIFEFTSTKQAAESHAIPVDESSPADMAVQTDPVRIYAYDDADVSMSLPPGSLEALLIGDGADNSRQLFDADDDDQEEDDEDEDGNADSDHKEHIEHGATEQSTSPSPLRSNRVRGNYVGQIVRRLETRADPAPPLSGAGKGEIKVERGEDGGDVVSLITCEFLTEVVEDVAAPAEEGVEGGVDLEDILFSTSTRPLHNQATPRHLDTCDSETQTAVAASASMDADVQTIQPTNVEMEVQTVQTAVSLVFTDMEVQTDELADEPKQVTAEPEHFHVSVLSSPPRSQSPAHYVPTQVLTEEGAGGESLHLSELRYPPSPPSSPPPLPLARSLSDFNASYYQHMRGGLLGAGGGNAGVAANNYTNSYASSSKKVAIESVLPSFPYIPSSASFNAARTDDVGDVHGDIEEGEEGEVAGDVEMRYVLREMSHLIDQIKERHEVSAADAIEAICDNESHVIEDAAAYKPLTPSRASYKTDKNLDKSQAKSNHKSLFANGGVSSAAHSLHTEKILNQYKASLKEHARIDEAYQKDMQEVQLVLGEKLFDLASSRVLGATADTPSKPTATAAAAPLSSTSLESAATHASAGLSSESIVSMAQERIGRLSDQARGLQAEVNSLKLSLQVRMEAVVALTRDKDALSQELAGALQLLEEERIKARAKAGVGVAVQTNAEELATTMRPSLPQPGQANKQRQGNAYSSVPLIEDLLYNGVANKDHSADRKHSQHHQPEEDALSSLLFNRPVTQHVAVGSKPASAPRTDESAFGAAAGEISMVQRGDAQSPQSYEDFDPELAALDLHLQSLIPVQPGDSKATGQSMHKGDTKEEKQGENSSNKREVVAYDADGVEDKGGEDKDFEVSRLQWEMEQMQKKHHDLQIQFKKNSRELELYKTKIFTVVQQEGGLHYSTMRSMPHVNFSYPLLNNPLNPQDILSLSSESYHGQETLYIVSRLVESHNDDLNRIEQLEKDKQKLGEQNHKLTSELKMLYGENKSKDEQIGKLRSMLSQAS